ncbi:hypothetical protein MXB_1423, partial [Myxobolus squamalis]
MQTRSLRTNKEFLPCRRKSLHVDFREIGWNSWILFPKLVNAFQCEGTCMYYHSLHINTTENALVRALMHEKPAVTQPCCIPSKLS